MTSKSIFRAALLAAVFLAASACTTTTQYSSGMDYVARYQKQSTNAAALPRSRASLDDDILRIASVEPMLEFPARVGLARIHRRQLTTPPLDEAQTWQEMSERVGNDYISFVPVSPMITNMVTSELSEHKSRNIISQIRAGAARQHLDYVLVYEVMQKDDRISNGLRLADLSILGLFVLPSRDVEVDVTASAMLIDVRNGYPYGSTSVFKTKTEIATLAGSNKRAEKMTDKLRILAVTDLTDEVETMTRELRIKRAEYKLAQKQ